MRERGRVRRGGSKMMVEPAGMSVRAKTPRPLPSSEARIVMRGFGVWVKVDGVGGGLMVRSGRSVGRSREG